MGKKDTITKNYMKENRVFADAFNYLLYNGHFVALLLGAGCVDYILLLQTWKMEEKSIGKYGEITKISNDV